MCVKLLCLVWFEDVQQSLQTHVREEVLEYFILWQLPNEIFFGYSSEAIKYNWIAARVLAP